LAARPPPAWFRLAPVVQQLACVAVSFSALRAAAAVVQRPVDVLELRPLMVRKRPVLQRPVLLRPLMVLELRPLMVRLLPLMVRKRPP
jgi:hypothetical protein